jgi:hypothetical protein
MVEIVRAPDFPSPQNSSQQLLNCIRVLTRLMPFIYENKNLEEWENRLFWSTTAEVGDVKKGVSETKASRKSESINDDDNAPATTTITFTAATPPATGDAGTTTAEQASSNQVKHYSTSSQIHGT